MKQRTTWKRPNKLHEDTFEVTDPTSDLFGLRGQAITNRFINEEPEILLYVPVTLTRGYVQSFKFSQIERKVLP